LPALPVANDTFSIAVPFAPRWPLEVHVRARPHGIRRLGDLSDAQLIDLAGALHDVVARYDALYGIDLPYMMCFQEAPGGDLGDWHLHVEFLPPHRDADRLKVRASVETALGVFINDTVPEVSAARLAAVDVEPRHWGQCTVPAIVDAS
jgi:UDPglucose--hexose-1-phosphate uridylyltransferase